MIDAQLNQSATWRQQDGTYTLEGQPNFKPDQALAPDSALGGVRWEHSRRIVRNPRGEEVVSEARVFTLAAVEPNDQLIDEADRAYVVITVSPKMGLDGTENHREVYL